MEKAWQQCINSSCAATYSIDEILPACPTCGNLLDIKYDWNKVEVPSNLNWFEKRWSSRNNPLDYSGVWRFRNFLGFTDDKYVATVGEGQTILQRNDQVGAYAGMNPGSVYLEYEGCNPSGSFKDNGMSGAFTHARMVGARHAVCASTGNTSASLALYAHACDMASTVFIGSGRIAYGKLSQALDYGARTLQVRGNFDDCMKQVQDVARQEKLYLVNSVNPFRLEGQKTIMYRILEGLNWQVPDWIVVPGGNLGNSSAFGKAFAELKELGLIDRIPRLAIIVAQGADTLYELYTKRGLRLNSEDRDAKIKAYYAELDASGYTPDTVATAIEISRPVNLVKCLRALDICDGVVRSVSDEQIIEAKAVVGKYGLGCEPASAATIAGLKQLQAQGIIGNDQRVACVLTGHQLKDPTVTVTYHIETAGIYSNKPIEVDNDLQAIISAMNQ
ncbi:MAG: threonine synthase [Sedimentisphaerales bacterium]|nr:threonine synthase [Sedimentisphaerales bacterium]MBN2843682.1 threonine synthase [Sedimentisphaerales bacterium]